MTISHIQAMISSMLSLRYPVYVVAVKGVDLAGVGTGLDDERRLGLVVLAGALIVDNLLHAAGVGLRVLVLADQLAAQVAHGDRVDVLMGDERRTVAREAVRD